MVMRLVARESLENPSIEADELLNRLVKQAYSRQSTVRVEDLIPPEVFAALHVTGEQENVSTNDRKHPLL